MLGQALAQSRQLRTDPRSIGGPDSLRELIERQPSGQQVVAQSPDRLFPLEVRDTPQPLIQPGRR